MTTYKELAPELLALADSLTDAPATAAVIRGFAHEVTQHLDDRDLTNAVAAWPMIVQHHAERERRLRDLTDALEGTARADETSAYDADLLHVVVGRLRDALDPPPAETEQS